MPRSLNFIPKYRKHRASGQAIVTIAGKDHYLGPHGTKSSHMLYDRLVAEFLSAGRQVFEPTCEQSISVVEVLAAFWRHCKAYYVKDGKPTKERDAFRLIIGEVRSLYGEVKATEFGPKSLKAIRQRWLDRGHCRLTINKNVRRLTLIFRWAASEELIPVSVHLALATVSGLKKGRTAARESLPVLPVELGVVEKTLPYLPEILRDMVRIQLLTGMRPGEICRLRSGDVNRSNDVWEYRPGTHKTEHHSRSRLVFIGPESQVILAPYLLRAPQQPCFSPAESMAAYLAAKHGARRTPLSYGNRPGSNRKAKPRKQPGDQYTPSSYRRAIHRACDLAFPPPEPLRKRVGETEKQLLARLSDSQKAELVKWESEQRWSPNQLRHAAATEIRKRFGLEAAQVILGHAAADVTQVYAERDAEKARDVIRQIG